MESEADSTLNRGKKRNLEENEKDIWGGAETRAQKRRMEEITWRKMSILKSHLGIHL